MDILKILIYIAIMVCSCSAEVYNWNIKAVEDNAESKAEFGNELKQQSALGNELQRDLLKMSGKENDNENLYENSNKNAIFTNLAEAEENLEKQKSQYESSGSVNEPNLSSDFNDNIGISNNMEVHNFKANIKSAHDGSVEQSFRPKTNYDVNDENLYENLKSSANDVNKYNSPLFDSQYEHMDMNNYQNGNIEMVPFKGNEVNRDFHNIIRDNNNLFDPFRSINTDARNFAKMAPKTLPNFKDLYEKSIANNPKFTEEYLKEWQNNYNQNQTFNEKNFEDFSRTTRCPATGSLQKIDFLGSNLFDQTARKCLTGDDVVLLTIRKDFENLMPKDLPQCLLNDHMVAVLMNYFYVCHTLISTVSSGESKQLVLKSFFDTLGGYLNYYLVPVARYSYYAGELGLETTFNILRLHGQCKNYLNTNGNGWRPPMRNVLMELNDVSIQPLLSNENIDNNEPSYCMYLDLTVDHTKMDYDTPMMIPLPKLEVKDDFTNDLGNIWLPFRRKRVYNLKSPKSAFIVAKFYETVANCYSYENLNSESYDSHFQKWIMENIMPHLSDDVFYPGLGAILRVAETLSSVVEKTRYESSFRGLDYNDMSVNRKKRRYHTFSTPIVSQNLKENPSHRAKHFRDYSHLQHDKAFIKNIKDSELSREHRQQVDNDTNVDDQSSTSSNSTLSQFNIKEITPIRWLIIIVPILVIIIILIISTCIKRRKRIKGGHVQIKEPKGKRKSKSSPGEEEEPLLLTGNSKSVFEGDNTTTKNNRFKAPPHMRNVTGSTGSSSSSLMCQLPAKCFAIKRSGPAIIETTSLDYSSSDAEGKEIEKAHMKSIKIDEKTGKNKNKNKKGKNKDDETSANNGQPKNANGSKTNDNSEYSWETIYSTK